MSKSVDDRVSPKAQEPNGPPPPDPEKLARSLVESRGGFYRMKDDDSIVKKEQPNDYLNKEKYSQDINACFNYRIDYYPNFDKPKNPFSPWTWDYFVDINDKSIEHRFPRDKGIRALITAYRLSVLWNQRSNIITKRTFQFFASTAIYIPLILHSIYPSSISIPYVERVGSISTGINVAFIYVVVAAAIAILFSLLRNTTARLSDAVESGGRLLSQKLASYINNLQVLYEDFLSRVHTESTGSSAAGRESRPNPIADPEWPNRSKWWTQLSLWIPRRIEYIEKFLQSEMQRLRIYILWTDIIGNLSAYGLSLIFAIAVYFSCSNKWDSSLEYTWFVITALTSVLVAWFPTTRKFSFEVKNLHQFIGKEAWPNSGELDVHEQIGELIRQSKEDLRQEKLRGGGLGR